MAGLRRGIVPAWWLHHPAVGADGFCLLAALSVYADTDGNCFPSQGTLARHLGRSRPWVNKVLGELAAAGLLSKSTRTRGDGGQTSCLYKLRTEPPADVTGAWHTPDTPRHRDDTSQDHTNQPGHTRAAPGGIAAGAQGSQLPDGQPREAPETVPEGWEPGGREVSEARRICPGADLDSHTVRFVARCRAKGYRYMPGAVGDAWLSWLIDDTRASSAPAHAAWRGIPARSDKAAESRGRMSAWARAANVPSRIRTGLEELR